MKKSPKLKYWTKETDDAIVLFCNTEDEVERNKIYNEKIHAPLSKLVECIYFTFKFQYIYDSPINIQADALTHCFLQLHKFNPNGGFKAFSYFSIITKNYFIQLNNKRYKYNNIHVEITDEENEENKEKILIKSIIAESNDRENRILTIQQKKKFRKIFEYYKLNSCGTIEDRKLLNRIREIFDAGGINWIFEGEHKGRYPIWQELSKDICTKGSTPNKIRKIFSRVGVGIIRPRKKYIFK